MWSSLVGGQPWVLGWKDFKSGEDFRRDRMREGPVICPLNAGLGALQVLTCSTLRSKPGWLNSTAVIHLLILCRMGVAAVPAVPSFVYRHIFLSEGKKRADSLSRDLKTEFCLLFLLLSNKSHLRTLDRMGPSLAGSKAFPREWITYSKFSADQKKCLLSCSVFFFSSHCFISLTASLRPKWYLSGVIGKRWRRCSRLPEWKISKPVVHVERTYYIWSFLMISADMMHVCIL